LENKKTDAISGGSLGTLYELLILEALARESPEDREIPKKIVFLQEIAFYMWSTEYYQFPLLKLNPLSRNTPRQAT